MALSLPPLPQTRTLEKKERKKRKHQSSTSKHLHGKHYCQNIMEIGGKIPNGVHTSIIPVCYFVTNNKLRQWQPTVVGGRAQEKKGCIPSSAFLSHSTNFFICSRKTLFPLAKWASLYHFRTASSLKTSALKECTKKLIVVLNTTIAYVHLQVMVTKMVDGSHVHIASNNIFFLPRLQGWNNN